MAKSIDEQAPGDAFQVVPGKESWKGVNTHDDPSAIDDNEFQWAQNIRINGSKVNARLGQEKFINATIGAPGPVDGIWNTDESSSMATFCADTNTVNTNNIYTLWGTGSSTAIVGIDPTDGATYSITPSTHMAGKTRTFGGFNTDGLYLYIAVSNSSDGTIELWRTNSLPGGTTLEATYTPPVGYDLPTTYADLIYADGFWFSRLTAFAGTDKIIKWGSGTATVETTANGRISSNGTEVIQVTHHPISGVTAQKRAPTTGTWSAITVPGTVVSESHLYGIGMVGEYHADLGLVIPCVTLDTGVWAIDMMVFATGGIALTLLGGKATTDPPYSTTVTSLSFGGTTWDDLGTGYAYGTWGHAVTSGTPDPYASEMVIFNQSGVIDWQENGDGATSRYSQQRFISPSTYVKVRTDGSVWTDTAPAGGSEAVLCSTGTLAAGGGTAETKASPASLIIWVPA